MKTLYKRLRRYIRTVRYNMINLDYSKIDDVEVGGIRGYDAPKFVDAYIGRATYKGREMSEMELDKLNEDSEFVYEAVQRHLY